MTAITETPYGKYERLFLTLKEIITKSYGRVVQSEPDSLFEQNVNFFTKAYLINLCTYLEAFLQDIAAHYLLLTKQRIRDAKVPTNLILWAVSAKGQGDLKEKSLKFNDFDLNEIDEKTINSELSGNPWKTITLFKKLGVDISRNSEFGRHKDLIETIVRKRNNIVHHNDQAIDVSMFDIIGHIDSFLAYMKAIESAVYNC